MLARIKTRKTPINIVNVTVARMFYPLKVYIAPSNLGKETVPPQAR